MSHAGVEESITSEGTPLEASTYTAGGKAFLFVAAKEDIYELRLKLGASKAEASRHASKSPDRFAIGATGWAKITFPRKEAGPRPILERWIDESHALFVPANSKAGPKGTAPAMKKFGSTMSSKQFGSTASSTPAAKKFGSTASSTPAAKKFGSTSSSTPAGKKVAAPSSAPASAKKKAGPTAPPAKPAARAKR
jgi:hypothetical protein